MFWLTLAIVFQLTLAGRLSTYAGFLQAKPKPAASPPPLGQAVVPDIP